MQQYRINDIFMGTRLSSRGLHGRGGGVNLVVINPVKNMNINGNNLKYCYRSPQNKTDVLQEPGKSLTENGSCSISK